MSREKESLRRRLIKAAAVAALLPLIVPLALLALTLAVFHRATLWILVQLLWLPRGKDVLLIYSDSTIWREYMLQEIVPLVQERAIVLNWSERRQWHWWSLPANVFRAYGKGRDYNPMVLLFRPMSRTRVFRFWSAFQDQKRGYPEPLGRLKQELFVAL